MSESTAPTTAKRNRMKGTPYEAQVVAAFKADISTLISKYPNAGISSLYKQYLADFNQPVSPSLFRKYLTASGFSFQRISQIVPTDTIPPTSH